MKTLTPTTTGTRAAMALLLACLAGVGAVPAAEATLVSADEPGAALVVSGTVYAADGTTPAAGITVHVHQANQHGEYTRLGTAGEGERIEGEVITGSDGRYLFRTIRPAAYPGTRVPPAHIHYAITDADGRRQTVTLNFDDDPRISDAARRRSRAAGRFGAVQPVTTADDGTLQVRFDIRLED